MTATATRYTQIGVCFALVMACFFIIISQYKSIQKVSEDFGDNEKSLSGSDSESVESSCSDNEECEQAINEQRKARYNQGNIVADFVRFSFAQGIAYKAVCMIFAIVLGSYMIDFGCNYLPICLENAGNPSKFFKVLSYSLEFKSRYIALVNCLIIVLFGSPFNRFVGLFCRKGKILFGSTLSTFGCSIMLLPFFFSYDLMAVNILSVVFCALGEIVLVPIGYSCLVSLYKERISRFGSIVVVIFYLSMFFGTVIQKLAFSMLNYFGYVVFGAVFGSFVFALNLIQSKNK